MDISTKAIALKSVDYGENDKIILLYSLEYGKISVRAKGIKKAKAKLKFAQEPFCFGTYHLAGNEGHFVLKTCDQLESFYPLREDIVRFYAGCVVLECLAQLETDGQPNSQLFVGTLKTLQCLTECEDVYVVVLHFLLNYLRLAGYRLDFSGCNVCGRSDKLYLDAEKGGVSCADCRGEGSVMLSAGVLNLLKLADGMTVEKMSNVRVPQSVSKDAIHALSVYISRILLPLKSVNELIRL